jgi:hypothetical protein
MLSSKPWNCKTRSRPNARAIFPSSIVWCWEHQVQGCAAGLLQSVSDENVLRKSSNGPRHDSAAGHRQWSVARVSLVCSCIARVLLLISASAMINTESKSFDCALVSTLETYDDPENGNYVYYTYYCNYYNYLQYVAL